jgi:16S rRNA U1498 N3-methylase RsmE
MVLFQITTKCTTTTKTIVQAFNIRHVLSRYRTSAQNSHKIGSRRILNNLKVDTVGGGVVCRPITTTTTTTSLYIYYQSIVRRYSTTNIICHAEGGKVNANHIDDADYLNIIKGEKGINVEVVPFEIHKLPRLYVGELIHQPIQLNNIRDLVSVSKLVKQKSSNNRYHIDSVIALSDDQTHYLITVLRIFRKIKSKTTTPQIRIFTDNEEEWIANVVQISSNSKQPQLIAVCHHQLHPCSATATTTATFTSNTDVNTNTISIPTNTLISSNDKLHQNIDREENSIQLQQEKQQNTKIDCYLCIAPPKNKDRVRYMIEKTTEFDCMKGYILLDTDHSEESDTKSDNKWMKKLQSYCIEASEQCERRTIPQFVTIASSPLTNNNDNGSNKITTTTTKLMDLLHCWSEYQQQPLLKDQHCDDRNNTAPILICRERMKNTISIWEALEIIGMATNKVDDENKSSTSPSLKKTAFVLIGPEGGWSKAEQEVFDTIENQCPKGMIYNVALTSSTILRTETAAISAVSTIATYHTYIQQQ